MTLDEYLQADPERTISAIARDARIAFVTASRAVHGKPVSERTKRKIEFHLNQSFDWPTSDDEAAQ